MANQYYKLVNKREVFASEAGTPLDLGGHKTIEAQIQCHSAGAGGFVYLQHSAVNENSAFTLLGTKLLVDGIGNNVQAHAYFLRYVRVYADAAIAGNPIVSVEIVAKDY